MANNLKAAVVITGKEFDKAEAIFTSANERIEWHVTAPDESSVAEGLRNSGAVCVVVGVQKYRGAVYEVLERNSKGKNSLIARFGVGVDSLDLTQCSLRNILVSNTPGALDASVAEHAIALILSLARGIPEADKRMREGAFSGKVGIELEGKTLVVIGLGRIGCRVARIAGCGFGMKVVGCVSSSLNSRARSEGCSPKEFLDRFGLQYVTNDFLEAVASADIVSAHLPSTPATFHFFNRERFSGFKPGARFVNTGRGALVDEPALYDLLASGAIGGAALDVFESEPYVPADPERDLRRSPNVVLTPHLASTTTEANGRMAKEVLRNIDCFLADKIAEMSSVS